MNFFKKNKHEEWPLMETLAEASYILNPEFKAIGDYIFLDYGQDYLTDYEQSKETNSEKIATEALENHVHLFENVKKRDQSKVSIVSISIAQNLLKRLKHEFPEKSFVVFLELKFKESVIVRFHQLRDKDDLYIDPKLFPKEYKKGVIKLFGDIKT